MELKEKLDMAISTYDEFKDFFGDCPRYENYVYTVSDNGHGKEGYRGKGYQVIVEREDWENELKHAGFLESCMNVVFRSLSGEWDSQCNDWIVGLIIEEIAEIDHSLYEKITDDEWFNKYIDEDYLCISDYYFDYKYDEKKYFEDIQSGKYKNYDEYIHHLAEDFIEYLKYSRENLLIDIAKTKEAMKLTMEAMQNLILGIDVEGKE